MKGSIVDRMILRARIEEIVENCLSTEDVGPGYVKTIEDVDELVDQLVYEFAKISLDDVLEEEQEVNDDVDSEG